MQYTHHNHTRTSPLCLSLSCSLTFCLILALHCPRISVSSSPLVCYSLSFYSRDLVFLSYVATFFIGNKANSNLPTQPNLINQTSETKFSQSFFTVSKILPLDISLLSTSPSFWCQSPPRIFPAQPSRGLIIQLELVQNKLKTWWSQSTFHPRKRPPFFF